MSLITLIASAGSAFSQWRRRGKAYAELMSLDDRSLADIGIHRSQISALVDGFGPDGDAAQEPATAQPRAFTPRPAKLAGGRWLPPV